MLPLLLALELGKFWGQLGSLDCGSVLPSEGKNNFLCSFFFNVSEAADFSKGGVASDEAVEGHSHCLACDSLFHYRIAYTNSTVLAEVLIMTVPAFIKKKKKKSAR